MNNYKVGCIADLISQTNGIKVKSSKKKLKAKEIKQSDNELVKTNTNEIASKGKKSKHINKTTELKKIFEEADNSATNLDETSLKCNNLISKKKRKKSESESLESNNLSKKKKGNQSSNESTKSSKRKFQSFDKDDKIGINLNFVPSDSEDEENKEEKVTEAPKISKQKRQYKDFTEATIFIGNIPINYDKQKVHKMFSKYGKIQSARIRCVPIADINMPKKVAAIKKQFNEKRNSLVAYVKYETQDSANAALEANGMVVDGHHLRVDLAEGKKENDIKKAVFVGGLPFDIEDDELWEFFQNCGKINSVRVIRDSQTSMGKGFGYVNFDSTAAVELALQMNGQELKKRSINVKRCVKAKNKNKLNAFGRKKSKEMTDQLLCKRGKKFKEEKKKKRNKGKEISGDFQGRKANIKEKKKKKLSKAALRQRKLVKILGGNKG